MCLFPKILENKKYKPNKKNGGKIPPLKDERTRYVPIACGKCIECMKMKAREWRIRLSEEIRDKTNETANFVTLTFDEKSLKYYTKLAIEKIKESEDKKNKILENEIATIATRRFLERWRKKYKKSIKHWLVTELGHKGTERIHMHGIIWTNNKEEIEKIWKNGITWIGDYVNERTINYIVKYIHKMDLKNKGYKPKVLTSAGIGKNYIKRKDSKNNAYRENGQTDETYRFRNGTKSYLPIYYRNKIYKEEEREKLWIEKINKGTLYIGGEKTDIKNGYTKNHLELLEWYRWKNKELGYGDDSKEWSIDEYKKNRKKLMQARKDS